MASEKITFHRYVRHADIPAFEAKGWRVECDLGPVHGVYSVMMVFTGEGDPS